MTCLKSCFTALLLRSSHGHFVVAEWQSSEFNIEMRMESIQTGYHFSACCVMINEIYCTMVYFGAVNLPVSTPVTMNAFIVIFFP
jgi:hypothetical protein